MSRLPRFELIQTVVAAPPRPPARNATDDNDIAIDGDGTSSDGQDEPQLEYITHLERSCDGGQVATALSSLKINLYSSDTMLANGQLSGHTDALTQLAFAPSDNHALFSASEDGTVRGWDVRSLSSTATFGQSGEEVWSMAVSGPSIWACPLLRAALARGSCYFECTLHALCQALVGLPFVPILTYKHTLPGTSYSNRMTCCCSRVSRATFSTT